MPFAYQQCSFFSLQRETWSYVSMRAGAKLLEEPGLVVLLGDHEEIVNDLLLLDNAQAPNIDLFVNNPTPHVLLQDHGVHSVHSRQLLSSCPFESFLIIGLE